MNRIRWDKQKKKFSAIGRKPSKYQEDAMIASPCKNCPKRNEPKENCINDCELLKAVQDIQYTSKEDFGIPGIDYAAVDRFTFGHLTAKGLSA
jgi:hypothetical protein